MYVNIIFSQGDISVNIIFLKRKDFFNVHLLVLNKPTMKQLILAIYIIKTNIEVKFRHFYSPMYYGSAVNTVLKWPSHLIKVQY